MFTLTSAECVPLTRDLVEQQFNMEPSPTERLLDPSRIKYLREKAEEGCLVTFHWASACLGNKTLRMNGQHSSTMLHELNGQFPEGLKVHRDEYKVEEPGDLAVLFRQFDARKSSRSSADVSAAYQGLHEDLKEVARPIAKLAIEGIAFHEKRVIGSRSKLGDDQYSLFSLQQHHPFIRWMGEIYSMKTPEMRIVPVAAAMYATYEVNESEARTFWQQVARGGIEFEDNAPATILDGWLKLAKSREERARVRPKQAEYYQGCLYAWNAYRDEKPIKDIRYRVEKGLLEPSH